MFPRKHLPSPEGEHMTEVVAQAGADFMMLVEFMALGIVLAVALVWRFGR